MAETHTLNTETKLDIPVTRVLDGAGEADLTGAVVLGWEEGGDLYFATSLSDAGEILLLLESAKALVIESVLAGLPSRNDAA